jgi:hypothetical protein
LVNRRLRTTKLNLAVARGWDMPTRAEVKSKVAAAFVEDPHGEEPAAAWVGRLAAGAAAIASHEESMQLRIAMRFIRSLRSAIGIDPLIV